MRVGNALSRRSVLAGLGAAAAMTGAPAIGRAGSGDGVAEAAGAWLSSLSAAQRDKAVIAFADGNRFDWHYFPRRRRGLPLKAMSGRQREAALEVLRAGLGATGLRKAREIMALEEVLRQMETFGFSRDSENYALTVFGTPGPDGAWGWRFEGHHLSINMTLSDGRLVAMTPMFLGSNPAVVPEGEHKGLEVLGDEIAAARALLADLEGDRRRIAIIAERSFGDIVAGPGREDALKTPEGLAASAMTPGQRDALVRLVEIYATALPSEDADAELARIRSAGLDTLHFAWAGATEPGGPHYFRVHGPIVLIEYDNTRNDANHVHSVWHDPANPFGRDVLGAHYRHGHAHG